MQNISLHKFNKFQRILFFILGMLMAIVLGLSLFSHNIVTKSRADGEYHVIENVTMTQSDNTDRQYECRFTLDKIDHAETLAFYIAHHEIRVYVGEECVYSLTAAENDRFITVGDAWVSIPIYEKDEGKEVRVLSKSLYEDYPTKTPEFLLGSEISVHNVTFHRALPALVLGICVIFAGVLLVCLASYHSMKGMFGHRLYALGMMAISAGVWRITYDRVAYLLLPQYAVFLYTLSVISMMGVALSMLHSLVTDEKGRVIVCYSSYAYCGVYALQLLLQALGIADIRQTLKLIHITIVISAATFVISGIIQCFKPKTQAGRRINASWMLGVGVIIDLLLYYFADTSINIVFTLVAILCYTVLEGIQLFFIYMQQQNALEEMEKDLMLSRTTTMMSQIRSHFVFNVLNAISGLCKYDPEKADETVVCFARYLRNNIDIMEKDGNIPFRTELQQLEDYVVLEQVRFGDKIEFYTDIEVDNFMIPPLILQPVVENAIKHGVSKKQGNGNIILRTREDRNEILIIVKDDGVGFDLAELDKEKSVGIRNIRFRLEHLVHGHMDIQSEVGKGTTVSIRIPKEEK